MSMAVVFPGQGSQHGGMGLDFLVDPQQNEWFDGVCGRLSFPLRDLLEEGDDDALVRTRVTQPAVFAVNHLVFRHLRDAGVEFDYFAGHSLGEYNALVAAGWSRFDRLLPVVEKRGEAMGEAAGEIEGGMAAVLKLAPDTLREICGEINRDPSVEGTVEVALLNAPGQTVVSGSNEAVDELVDRAGEAGALKAVRLDVSGPWHSQYMKPAQPLLKRVLDELDWTPGKPVVANVQARPVKPSRVTPGLLDQLIKPVNWIGVVEYLLERGVETFVEVGPGTVLTGLIERIARGAGVEPSVYSTDSLEQTQTTLAAIQHG